MGPIGISEKKAGGKEQQQHVCMICFVPAYRLCCFQNDSHSEIQCFSYISIDILFIFDYSAGAVCLELKY